MVLNVPRAYISELEECYVRMDQMVMCQILRSLVSMAIKNSPPGGQVLVRARKVFIKIDAPPIPTGRSVRGGSSLLRHASWRSITNATYRGGQPPASISIPHHTREPSEIRAELQVDISATAGLHHAVCNR